METDLQPQYIAQYCYKKYETIEVITSRKESSMFPLFYGAYLAFQGVIIPLAVGGVLNAFNKREDYHQHRLNIEKHNSYWNGYEDCFPSAFKSGQANMLDVCQALAKETLNMSQNQNDFNSIVDDWPTVVFPQLPDFSRQNIR
jgi:hypothetical protein